MNQCNKDKYGEVFTPVNLVEDMLLDALEIEKDIFIHCKRIFEPGAGKGIFYETFYRMIHVQDKTTYIMNEINEEHADHLRELVQTRKDEEGQVLIQDLFSVELDEKVDLVLGNLPFHNGGKAFVPGLAKFHGGNVAVTKPERIVTIWPKMIHYCFDHLLKDGGYFFCIIPCIWLKQDRACIYDLFVQKNQICLLKVFDCVQANSLFGYNCQTPICYVLVKKGTHTTNTFKLFDASLGLGIGSSSYIDFTLKEGYCIPTKHAMLFKTSSEMTENGITCYDKIKKISSLKPGLMDQVIQRFDKSNVAEVGTLEDYPCDTGQHKVITGASLVGGGNTLILHGVVSGMDGLYAGIPKLILPHKRLLRCFKDYDGTYSCYGRDMYVFLFEGTTDVDSRAKIDALEAHLSSHPQCLMIEKGFTIRMNFIEKYVFQYVSWIKE
jgi:hypothetical protein